MAWPALSKLHSHAFQKARQGLLLISCLNSCSGNTYFTVLGQGKVYHQGFIAKEWLTKSQVQGFFLPSQWQKEDNKVLQKLNLTIDICYKKTRSLKGISLLQKSLKNWDRTTHYHMTLSTYVSVLRSTYFSSTWQPFKSRERKRDVIDELSSFIQECTCFSPSAQEWT